MALPTWQAAGTALAGLEGFPVSPEWPTHAADDIGFLVVESTEACSLTVPAGFREVPVSPQKIQVGATTRTRLSVYWCRATSSSMSAPTVDAYGDHKRAVIVTVRGVNTVGVPWNVCAGDTNTNVFTAVTIPGGTTTHDNCLIMNIVSHDIDNVSSDHFSGWTNADLTSITERFDSSTAVGLGSGIGIATGVKATAGLFGDTTATLDLVACQGRIMLALTGEATDPLDDTPYTHNWGASAGSSSAAVSPDWPVHESGDVGFLIVSSGSSTITLTDAAGFTQLTSSPQGGGGVGGVSSAWLAVYWKRATSSSEASPTVAFGAEHLQAAIFTVRGAITTGVPIDVTAGDGTASASSSVTFPGMTTGVNHTLIVHVNSHATGNNNFRALSWTNADLLDLRRQLEDNNSSLGTGSGLWVTVGRKETAGAFTNTVGALGSSTHQGRVLFAVPPPVAGTTVALTGVSTSGALGTVQNSSSVPTTGVEALAEVGSTLTDHGQPLSGVVGTGEVGGTGISPVLLLGNDNAADGTLTFDDQSSGNHTVTPSGGPEYDTAWAPTGMTSSVLFDGVDSKLTVADHADFGFGTGDFTIEMMVNLATTDGSHTLFDMREVWADVGPDLWVIWNSIGFRTTDTSTISGTISVPGAHHIAVSRKTGSTRLFVDGVQVGLTYADTNDYGASSLIRFGLAIDGNSPLNGWMSNVRVIKGSGLYDTNFTPPTLPLSESGGEVLTINVIELSGVQANGQVGNVLATGQDGEGEVEPGSTAGLVYTETRVIDNVGPTQGRVFRSTK